MRPGVFARTFPGTDPAVVLGAAGAAGFKLVQYNFACSGIGALPQVIGEATIDALRQAVADTGVGIAAISATYNMIHPDPAARRAGRMSLAAIAAAAQALGVPIVTVCTGTRDEADPWRHHPANDTPEAWAAFMTEMAAALAIAADAGVRLGMEPEPGNIVANAQVARRVLDEFASPRLGIVLDPANLMEAGPRAERAARVDQAVALLGGDVILAHAKDRTATGAIVPAGQGDVDFPAFLAALAACGFDGPVIAHGFEANDAAGVAAHLADCLPG